MKEEFADFQLAINVQKHGRGRSYDALILKADWLPFRVKRPGEGFFFGGDVSEVVTLIDVDDAFALGCAEVIRRVSESVKNLPLKSSYRAEKVTRTTGGARRQ